MLHKSSSVKLDLHNNILQLLILIDELKIEASNVQLSVLYVCVCKNKDLIVSKINKLLQFQLVDWSFLQWKIWQLC